MRRRTRRLWSGGLEPKIQCPPPFNSLPEPAPHAAVVRPCLAFAAATMSTPVVSEGMVASGFSLGACTAGRESGSGEGAA